MRGRLAARSLRTSTEAGASRSPVGSPRGLLRLVPAPAPQRRTLLGWATSAAIGGFVFGYQVGVISGALLSIRRDFGLGDFEQCALVSILPLGAMAGGLLTVRLADTLLGPPPRAATRGVLSRGREGFTTQRSS